GSRGAGRARRTRLRGKLDNDRATALAPAVLPPGRRQVPLGTAYLLLVPVHHKLLWAYAPSTWACQPWLGRVGPRRIMSCASRLRTRSSELIYAASTRCSRGGTSFSMSAC